MILFPQLIRELRFACFRKPVIRQNNICFGFHLFSRFNKLLGRIKVAQCLHKVSILFLVLLCFLVGSDGISKCSGNFFLPKKLLCSYVTLKLNSKILLKSTNCAKNVTRMSKLLICCGKQILE